MTGPIRYRRKCNFEHCARMRRDEDVFCGICYKSLPQHLRYALFGDDIATAIKNAKQWLDDKWNNRLIVVEEGP